MQISTGFSSSHSPYWDLGLIQCKFQCVSPLCTLLTRNLGWLMQSSMGLGVGLFGQVFGTKVFFMFELCFLFLFYDLFILYLLCVCNIIYIYICI